MGCGDNVQAGGQGGGCGSGPLPDLTQSGPKRVDTSKEEFWIEVEEGHKVYAHLHCPAELGAYPGVVLVPGGFGAGIDFDNDDDLNADDIASRGIAVLHYDPTGRGHTEGDDDHWGAKHQSELAQVVTHFKSMPSVDDTNIGILSFSMGVTIASGALANHDLSFVKYLFDWEGPSNRHITTKENTFEPFVAWPTSNDDFWREREASSFIGKIGCGYFRYQGDFDHVQGENKDHAVELVNIATNGNAAWTRLNDNPEDTVIDSATEGGCHWIAESEDSKELLLKYLLDVQKKVASK